MYRSFFQMPKLLNLSHLVLVNRFSSKNRGNELKLGETKKKPASNLTQGHPGQRWEAGIPSRRG